VGLVHRSAIDRAHLPGTALGDSLSNIQAPSAVKAHLSMEIADQGDGKNPRPPAFRLSMTFGKASRRPPGGDRRFCGWRLLSRHVCISLGGHVRSTREEPGEKASRGGRDSSD